MLSIFKKEFSGYFNSVTGYLAIGIFLLASGLILWVFPNTSILAYGYASLGSFFDLTPYLLTFLIPVITMRSIAGEKSDGTYMLLLTKPINSWDIVVGKFLGNLALVTVILLATSIYLLSVYYLAAPVGNVDVGQVIGSYLGLFLICSVFTAIGILSSAISKTPITAFLVGVFACFFVFYAFGGIAQLSLFSGHERMVEALGLEAHYEAISRGVLDLRDLAYFISILGVFLFATQQVVDSYRNRTVGRSLIPWMFLLLIIVVANFLVASRVVRIDFTAEKRFTLSEISKETARAISRPTHIEIYLDGDLPAGFQRLKRAVSDLLYDMGAYAGGNLTFSYLDPMRGDEAQQSENIQILLERNIQPTNLNVRSQGKTSQQLIFPAASIVAGEGEMTVNLLQSRGGTTPEQSLNASIENLEYTFVSALRKLMADGQPLVGFTEGNGELDDLQLHDAIHELASGYQVGRVDLGLMTLKGLEQMDVLIIAKPTKPFSELQKFKIDHFVMNGGHLIWALDQTTADLDSLIRTGEQMVLPRTLNLDDILFTYGLRFNYNLVADMHSGHIPLNTGNVGGQPQIELVPWLFHPHLLPTTAHPILKNTDAIITAFAGTIDTIAVVGVQKEFVLYSSPFSRLLNVPAPISLQMAGEEPEPEKFRSDRLPVAAILQGQFPSVFRHRSIPPELDTTFSVPDVGVGSKMIAIADGDVFRNQVNPTDGSTYPLGWDRYAQQQYGNKSFLFNILDYLTDDEGLILLRDKEIKIRMLDPVSVRQHQLHWQLFNVALPPILLLLAVLFRQFYRKRKFGKAEVAAKLGSKN